MKKFNDLKNPIIKPAERKTESMELSAVHGYSVTAHRNFLMNTDISAAAKLLYQVLVCDADMKTSGCWVSEMQLGKDLGWNIKSVHRYLDELESLHLITTLEVTENHELSRYCRIHSFDNMSESRENSRKYTGTYKSNFRKASYALPEKNESSKLLSKEEILALLKGEFPKKK